MKRSQRICAMLMAVTMMVTLLFNGGSLVFAAPDAPKDSFEVFGVEDVTYEIYPIPQEIAYGEGVLQFTSLVNVVFDDAGIDEATVTRTQELVAGKDLVYSEGEAMRTGKTNLLVGIWGSGGAADQYLRGLGLGSDEHFAKTDAHMVVIRDNVMAVVGRDTDAAFFGLTTLRRIFAQTKGYQLRELAVTDYSDAKWRGFIEGYYGIPWSNEDRMSLMEFGGEFKMNS